MADFIKLDAKNTSTFNKIKNGTDIGTEMQDDGNADVQAHGSTVKTASAQLQAAENAQTAAQTAALNATKVALAAEKEYDKQLKLAANKVEEVYPENPTKYSSLKFKLRDDVNSEATEPIVVTGFNATLGDKSGEADLNWNSVDDESIQWYNVEINSVDPTVEANWSAAKPATSKPSKVTVAGLTPGTRYWFRVSAHNDFGDGGPSIPDSIIVN